MNPNNLNRFETNPVSLDIPRSVFPMNHSFKGSFNVGEVIPFDIMEVLPGDTFSIDTSKVVRLQPLVTPIMDDVFLDTYWFFIPNRLVWNHFKEFFGENTQGAWTPQVEYSIPQVEIPEGGYQIGTIADYMGIPVGQGAGQKFSALQFRAYARVMDEWFRSENLMNPVNVNLDDTDITGSNGSDQVTDIVKGGKPFIACKTMDYFTAALPQPQKGPAVTLPLGQTAPLGGVAPVFGGSNNYDYGDVVPTGMNPIIFGRKGSEDKFTANTDVRYASLGVVDNANPLGFNASGSPAGNFYPAYPMNLQADLDVTGAFADLTNATASTVNQLRQAFAIQKYYEKAARGGTRYVEYVKAMFNVTSPDSRIQRTEYLGGNRVSLNVTQVEQTSATEESISTPQGNVVGMSHTGDVHSDFTKSFTEHGFVLGVCVARYHHSYQNGLPRQFSRKTVFDFYNPLFANLGEQAVMTKEIYLDDDNEDDVFGYQEAWSEYRFAPNRVAGEMRSNASAPLDMWHLADDYESAPQLGDSWIREDKSNLDRCLAVTSDVSNQIIADFYIKAEVARCMPMYSVPGLIDHH